MITWLTFSLASIGGATSPVKAPLSSPVAVLGADEDLHLVGLDQRLDRADVGEGRVHRDWTAS